MWIREEECGKVIESAWKKGEDAAANMVRMARELKVWSNLKFGDFAKEMR